MKAISITLLLLLSVVVNLNSQPNYQNVSLSEFTNAKTIPNLVMGLKNENRGVKRDCIYFAGLYRIPQAFEYLEELLDCEQDESTLKLAILAMYRIDCEHTIDCIKNYKKRCENSRIKKLCQLIEKEYSSSFE